MTGKSLSSPSGATVTSPRGVTEAAVLEVCSSRLLSVGSSAVSIALDCLPNPPALRAREAADLLLQHPPRHGVLQPADRRSRPIEALPAGTPEAVQSLWQSSFEALPAADSRLQHPARHGVLQPADGRFQPIEALPAPEAVQSVWRSPHSMSIESSSDSSMPRAG